MIKYESIKELVEEAQRANKKISDLVIEEQAYNLERTPDNLIEEMSHNLKVMEEAVLAGIKPGIRSASGLSGGDAYKLNEASKKGILLGGSILNKAIIKAVAVAEVNACMGRIVAAPTAGSCGIIPAALLTAKEEKNIDHLLVVKSLFTAAGFGIVIAKNASISGAEGGCQAECGSASAMAAAALVELMGGTPQMSANACAIALKGVLGLVCDPVGGLVEVPCIKRNAQGVANAIVASDLALAGIESVIPADEVIEAMKSVGNLMPAALKETAAGGLASTPTAKRLENTISYG
ncbi:MAG TPA: L-serine ammonia-lyase, iron-sulfur-dependent, subunit alpha [Clostridiaceae bacterium]|nr:L-serine ammonia-lyase, iron-sulfur-dependent, subunit alpha [Clostridiaceae bacterium]